jgi:hypothetical protein
MLFAVQPTNQAKQPQVTTNKPVSPQTRKLAVERQQHAGTVAGLDVTTPLSAQLLEKNATIAGKTITSHQCVKVNL